MLLFDLSFSDDDSVRPLSPRSVKRQKRDAVKETPPPNLRKCRKSSRFWFADGNIVIHAEQKLFRVHTTLIGLHSPVLKERFANLQLKFGVYDGVPVCRLTDSAGDIDRLCKLLYGLYHLDLHGPDSAYLGTMIRLGRRYQISHLLKLGLKYLRQLFPATLESWDLAHAKIVNLTKKNRGFLFDIVNLAFEHGLPSILPAAYLSLCMVNNLDEITTGVWDVTLLNNPTHAFGAFLRSNAKQACTRGRMSFMGRFLKEFSASLRVEEPTENKPSYIIPGPGCARKWTCKRSLTEVLGAVLVLLPDEDAVRFPCHIKDLSHSPFCSSCQRIIESKFIASRQKVWAKLYTYFEVDDVQDLEDELGFPIEAEW